MYSGVGGINLRTEGDFNLHSDSNINMHANGQIRMSSASEMIQSADCDDEPRRKRHIQQFTAGSDTEITPGMAYVIIHNGTQLHGASGQFTWQEHRCTSTHTGGKSNMGTSMADHRQGRHALREEGDVELAEKGSNH